MGHMLRVPLKEEKIVNDVADSNGAHHINKWPVNILPSNKQSRRKFEKRHISLKSDFFGDELQDGA
jgi:hypothetical protein